jgi:hypothetical protein
MIKLFKRKRIDRPMVCLDVDADGNLRGGYWTTKTGTIGFITILGPD